MQLDSRRMVGLDNQHLKTSDGKLPTLETKKKEGGREAERGHYDSSLRRLPADEAFVFTWKYDLFFHHSEGLCLSLHTERIFFFFQK